MAFTSYGFIAFVAVLLVAYYLFPKKYQWTLLLAASYFFYAFSGIKNFAFIIATTLSCFFVAKIMEKKKEREDEYVELIRPKWTKRAERRIGQRKRKSAE